MTDSNKLDRILDEIKVIDEKVSALDGKFSVLDEKVSALDGKFNALDEKVTTLDTDLKDVRQRVIKMELTVENEIRVNIQRVAEGHLDLSRKLSDYIKLSEKIKAKQEIQDIYINMHENRLKAL
ncbi:MAG: hypothetical protein NC432_07270 [Roseburia sp.]|nr:hypothetical protein [Roseburia sp.]MCM1098953.1 hypothetical protein [Ruminococcus flavefaciens]